MNPNFPIKIGPWTLSQHSDGATIACYNGKYALTIDNRTCNVWSAPLKCKKGIYIQKWMTSRARKYLITLHALVPLEQKLGDQDSLVFNNFIKQVGHRLFDMKDNR